VRIIVNAAGLWARQFGEMAGLELPVTVVEHQYLVTEKTDRIPSGLPSLRDPDNNFYLKPEPGAFAIGGWEEGRSRRTATAGCRSTSASSSSAEPRRLETLRRSPHRRACRC
jgi:glycine/D-amino acid oxidase-like deaminating enzyme